MCLRYTRKTLDRDVIESWLRLCQCSSDCVLGCSLRLVHTVPSCISLRVSSCRRSPDNADRIAPVVSHPVPHWHVEHLLCHFPSSLQSSANIVPTLRTILGCSIPSTIDQLSFDISPFLRLHAFHVEIRKSNINLHR